MTLDQKEKALRTIVHDALRREAYSKRQDGLTLYNGEWLDAHAAANQSRWQVARHFARLVELLMIFTVIALVGAAFLVLTNLII